MLTNLFIDLKKKKKNTVCHFCNMEMDVYKLILRLNCYKIQFLVEWYVMCFSMAIYRVKIMGHFL